MGDAVTVLWNDGGETSVGYGYVVSEVPFAVEIEGDVWPEASAELRLVRDQGDRFVAGRATAAFVDEGLVMLQRVDWEEPSQRVHERREVEWPATLRILDDRGARETFQIGLTTDVSLGGAAIQLDDAPEVGALVELRAHPRDKTPLRAVGVVVRRTGYDIGIAFLYLWGAAHIETQDVRPIRRAA